MNKFWLVVAGYITLDAIGTWAAIKWLRGEGRLGMYLAWVCFSFCSALWLWTVSQPDSLGVAKLSAFFPIIAMMVGVTCGVLAKEQIGVQGWLGVVLGLLSIILVSKR